jgi:endoglucanase
MRCVAAVLAVGPAVALCSPGTVWAAAVPPGYSVDVDESGATASGNLGGSGSLTGSGQGNVNYGAGEECAPSSDGGPFSSGHYPPSTCAQLGRSYASSGSPEHPSDFWFTGNQNCVAAGRPYSGADFTWHVRLPAAGYWHVDAYIPTWTSYGFGNQYILTAADGQSQVYPLTQQAYHGQWIRLFGSHPFSADQEYTVTLTLADGADAFCHYQLADQMKWVYEGPPIGGHLSSSSRVALIPDAGENSQGGTMPTTGSVAGAPSDSFDHFSFSDVPLDQVNGATLSTYDTAVLMQVSTSELTPTARQALAQFVRAGGKLIIHDADGTTGNDYSWLPVPAATGQSCSNCGATNGTANVVEDNSLISSRPADPAYVNVGELQGATDAIGDANVMVTQDPRWFVDARATNSVGSTGAVHTYASDAGLIIFNGFDTDSVGSAGASGVDWLAKMWYSELSQGWNPDQLPRRTPVSDTCTPLPPWPDGALLGGVPRVLPALPLHAKGRWIVDRRGRRVKLASVNWYGAEEKDYVVSGLDCQKLDDIAKEIRNLGFNSVRLPFSNEMVERSLKRRNRLKVDETRLAANPDLMGRSPLEVYKAVVRALTSQGLLVILDDHTSNAEWCCSLGDRNGLWDSFQRTATFKNFSTKRWLSDWRHMAAMFRHNPAVVGADLRNELRDDHLNGRRQPGWYGGPRQDDWWQAAIMGGSAVNRANPNLLVMVEGTNYATNLKGVFDHPLTFRECMKSQRLPRDVCHWLRHHRVVYSPHDYWWDEKDVTCYDGCAPESALHSRLGKAWGFILTKHRKFTAPIWVGEFGTCHQDEACLSGSGPEGNWFPKFVRYLSDGDIDWSYWAVNGTEARGTETYDNGSIKSQRSPADEETYGVLSRQWNHPALCSLTDTLASLIPAHQGPVSAQGSPPFTC